MNSAFLETARAYCAAIDVYDRKSNPENMRKMTLAREAMREAYLAEQRASLT